jgi:hypothetical protein
MGNRKGTGKKGDGSRSALTEPSAPKIPKGWRRLAKGQIVKKGDMWWDEDPDELNWNETACAGQVIGMSVPDYPYIRRIKAAGPRAARKKKPTVESPDAEGGR